MHDQDPLPLRAEHIRNARLYANRLDALAAWPKQAAVAELGVAFGAFTKQILEHTAPTRFDAYDLFRLHEIETLWGRPSKDTFGELTHSAYYRKRFRTEIERGLVRVFEGDSSTEIARRDSYSYDVIYIDGDHTFPGVLRDARVSETVLKPAGLLVFNDYVFYDRTGYQYGVINVVNDLCVNHGWTVVYLALQPRMFCDIAITRIR